MAKNKPYKYNPKHNGAKAKPKSKAKPKVDVKDEKRLENTTRIRIDSERLDDFDSLDTSFLEGRLNKKLKSHKISKEKLYSEKKKKSKSKIKTIDFDLIKNIMITVLTICIVTLGIVFLVKNNFFLLREDTKKTTSVKKKVTVNSKVPIKDKTKDTSKIDDNYLFVGDFYTDKFDFGDLDYHYVKESSERKTTKEVKDNLNNNIYKYNPSIVFIELGMIDLVDDVNLDEIGENIEKIVKETKDVRPYAKIYIESIYPINRDVSEFNDKIINDKVDNDKIKDLNSKLKKIAKDNDVLYLDVYKLLEDDGKLNEKYTDDGVELNKDGYNKILKEIKKVVGKDE